MFPSLSLLPILPISFPPPFAYSLIHCPPFYTLCCLRHSNLYTSVTILLLWFALVKISLPYLLWRKISRFPNRTYSGMYMDSLWMHVKIRGKTHSTLLVKIFLILSSISAFYSSMRAVTVIMAAIIPALSGLMVVIYLCRDLLLGPPFTMRLFLATTIYMGSIFRFISPL